MWGGGWNSTSSLSDFVSGHRPLLSHLVRLSKGVRFVSVQFANFLTQLSPLVEIPPRSRFLHFLDSPLNCRYSTFILQFGDRSLFTAWHEAFLLEENFDNPRCQRRPTRLLSRKLDAYVRPFRPPTFDSCLHLRCILAGSVDWLMHTHSAEGR